MKKFLKKIKELLIFLLLVIVFWIIISLSGINKAMINWTFLVLLFGTSIGPNFFDNNLVKNRFLDEIKDENLILRKISFHIGLVFLYIGIYIPEKVIDSTFYSYLTGEPDILIKYSIDLFVKSIATLSVFATYWGAQNKIIYWIFSFYYRDKELKRRSKLAKIVLEEGIWKVEEKNIKLDITNLKRISIDTYQTKEDNNDTKCIVAQKSETSENTAEDNRDTKCVVTQESETSENTAEDNRDTKCVVAQKSETSENTAEDNRDTNCVVAQKSETSENTAGNNRVTYYVAQESEIPDKIEGKSESEGYPLLGVIDTVTMCFAILTIITLPAISILDSIVKVDNGIYSIDNTSDKTDISDTVEISGDTIIYNGKAETFDTRKQSFSMGKIEKNNGNNITIKFYKNGKEVQYKKD